ncbi:MAG: YgiQ family radical SAM protein [Syntrophales bacterium]|jgi:uncharacterized radical SAM protein YgiQ|nr:YgiQ family radical SAM protein [Syntrophales bacterium]
MTRRGSRPTSAPRGRNGDAGFLPATRKEMLARGWDRLDVVLVTGDAYIDSPFIGAAAVGRLLEKAGCRVGILAQPDVRSGVDIERLGEPELFWGVSGGSVDSMVANYTALGKPRRTDDFTPGGRNDRRPDRAVIAYANLIRSRFKPTKPIVLGGIEASLRRFAHYDYWTDAVRRSVLADAKADLLIYGMGEKAVLEIADRLRDGRDCRDVRGLCYLAAAPPDGAVVLPSFAEVKTDPDAFIRMFRLFCENQDPATARGLCQRQNGRWLVHNPPQPPLSEAELDAVSELPFSRNVHPLDAGRGEVRAQDTIRFSLTSHRGCAGECRFCAVALHQGRRVLSRSEASILREAGRLTACAGFRGVISDVGGPTANMYGCSCRKMEQSGACRDRRCLFPEPCPSLEIDHRRQIELLRKLRSLPGVRRVFIASGVRHDLVFDDRKSGLTYLRELAAHHVSGQLKLAPEHSEERVLDVMGKAGRRHLTRFKEAFDRLSREAGKKQFLTYYLLAAHPGCTDDDMRRLAEFARRELRLRPEQIQIFTPTPSTWSAVMYWTGVDPFSGKKLFVERTVRGKQRQKDLATGEAGEVRSGRKA